MSHSSPPPRRRRTATLAVLGLVLATVASTFGASPAAAANAPLVTTDGVGIRIDENAILGPALQLIENEMQVLADDLIQTGAEENSVMDNPDWVWTDNTLDLSFDFVNAGTAGFPQGGLKVHADIRDVRMQFYRYGEWWQPSCLIEVNPDDATIDASARIDTSKLPNAPLTVNPITAYWDEDPDVTIAEGPWTCNGYLIDEWWEGLWGSGTDVAAGIEADLNGQAQGLVDDLWAQHVLPVINSLDEFGVSFNQIRTDDHGLIVTANVNATNGITLPLLGGPYNVSGAQDSGVTSNINTLLANRASDAIVSIHPNVVNQLLTALNQYVGGYWSSDYLPASIETTLFGGPNPANRDDGYYYELLMNGEPAIKPTGTGGSPQLQGNVTLVVGHEDVGPLATFEGPVGGINLRTVIRDGNFGPDFNAASMTQSMTRTSAAAGVVATPATILPTARVAFAKFNADVFETFINLAPLSIGGLPVNVCTTCGRYSGDQRYTETFTIG